jgi:hypothetical protein
MRKLSTTIKEANEIKEELRDELLFRSISFLFSAFITGIVMYFCLDLIGLTK